MHNYTVDDTFMNLESVTCLPRVPILFTTDYVLKYFSHEQVLKPF